MQWIAGHNNDCYPNITTSIVASTDDLELHSISFIHYSHIMNDLGPRIRAD